MSKKRLETDLKPENIWYTVLQGEKWTVDGSFNFQWGVSVFEITTKKSVALNNIFEATQ